MRPVPPAQRPSDEISATEALVLALALGTLVVTGIALLLWLGV